MFSCTDYDLCDSDFNRSSTLLFHSASNAAPPPLLPEWTDHYPQGLIQRPTTPLYEPYQYGNQPSVTPGIFDQNFSISGDPAFLHSADTSSSRSSSIFGYGTSAESFSHAPEYSTIHSFDSGRSFCNTVSSISIPSPPRLFADTPISRTNHFINPAHLEFTGLLPPITDALLQAHPKRIELSHNQPQSVKKSKRNPSQGKAERPKRKRMHICNLCGKDFNRPSALLLHSTVHTGERSNFCNVCGRSFSNLSNLRRHQRQLHASESEVQLPEIPGPTSVLDAYNFGSQTRF
ncbi:hypothetical protein Pst134EA_022962 [Puccinia striiformis f. sp. tritici]|uniref:hypothetical protein n=1 Tax=Puccinia striiformis f. sp. tritici TaxID=168172 RepID=UPI00200740C4|nr:hypothetical protein Pst134EA_022962 [Puccinia striiformis f. sp. tritici]KAH9455500.1 hypothetical protein Pst134EA_022962 [Puccinia striiformis f. sp. tritici]